MDINHVGKNSASVSFTEAELVLLNSFEEVKDDEYRYWQSVPPAIRIEAAFRLRIDLYRMKGIEPDGAALKRSLIRVEFPRC